MNEKESIRTAIVEDDAVVRECLSLMIAGTPGYKCVGSFSSMEEALSKPFAPIPNVLLLDIHLPGMLGSDGVKVFREKYPAMQILMLTIYAEQDKIFES